MTLSLEIFDFVVIFDIFLVFLMFQVPMTMSFKSRRLRKTDQEYYYEILRTYQMTLKRYVNVFISNNFITLLP